MEFKRGLLIGQRYELVGLLDEGGMGSVWSARDRKEDRLVALKLQTLGGPRSATALRRFGREARALASLRSAHVVEIFDHGIEGAVAYIAMELLNGESVSRRAERCQRLSPPEVSFIVCQAARGLAEAHARGIVHRDIKPSNLFIVRCSDGELVKLIDFGIARGKPLETSTEATGSGLVGSPRYMSPEQARGERVDAATDRWALAVVAFRLLTGREPFAGKNVPDTLQRICSGQVPSACTLVPGLSRQFDVFFERAFAVDPVGRFGTAEELALHLEGICAHAFEPSLGTADERGRLESTKSFSLEGALVPTARNRSALRVWGVGVIGCAALGALLLAQSRAAPSAPSRRVASAKSALLASVPVDRASPTPTTRHELKLPAPTTAAQPVASSRQKLVQGARTRVSPVPLASVPVSKATSVDPIFGLPLGGASTGDPPLAITADVAPERAADQRQR